MDTLFGSQGPQPQHASPQAPLAERMRPRSLEGYIGQQHLLGEGGALRKSIASGHLPSIVLWGPPGTGKTTLARILAHHAKKPFFALSAISAGVKEVRALLDEAARLRNQPVVFIDEIHRFNKNQQDALLGAVEAGTIILIGATTENPSFEVNGALLSRCQVYVLEAHTADDLRLMLKKAVEEDTLLGRLPIELKEDEALLHYSGGDARKLYNALELTVRSLEGSEPLVVTNAAVQEAVQKKAALYDKSGEQHYDIISAFIKSMRGSDPNAALYWMARMLEGGEDPLFVARRMLILASEDIGNANPNALVLATATFQAIERIGMPEGRIILAQAVAYLASSPKSNASYMAIGEAMSLVKKTGDLPVPMHLRNAPTKLMKELGYSAGYQYSHDYQGNFSDQEFLPDKLSGTRIYDPSDNPREKEMRKFLKDKWKDKYGY